MIKNRYVCSKMVSAIYAPRKRAKTYTLKQLTIFVATLMLLQNQNLSFVCRVNVESMRPITKGLSPSAHLFWRALLDDGLLEDVPLRAASP